MKLCPRCRRRADDGAETCAVCGGTLIEIAACPHCGKPNEAKAEQCVFCGKPMKKEAPKEEEWFFPVKKAPEEEAESGTSAEAPEKEEPAEARSRKTEEKAPAKKTGEGRRKKAFAAIAAVLLIAAALIATVAAAAGREPSAKYALYLKDGSLYGAKLPGGATERIEESGRQYHATQISVNGKYAVIFEEDGGALYLKKLSSKKAAAMVNDGVKSFLLSSDGKSVVYLKNGVLHRLTVATGRDKAYTKTQNVAEFTISSDAKTILYITANGKLGFIKNGRERANVASDAGPVLYTSEDLKVAYFMNDDTVCRLKLTKAGKPEEVAFGMEKAYIAGKNTAYFVVRNGDGGIALQYYNGRKTVTVEKDLKAVQSAEDGVTLPLFYTRADDEHTVYAALGRRAVKVKGLDAAMLKEAIHVSPDGKTAFALTYGKDLLRMRISKIAVSAAKKYDADVEAFGGFTGDGTEYYFKDHLTGSVFSIEATLYIKGKRSAQTVYRNSATSVGKMLYFTDVAMNLYVYDGKTVKKIVTGVYAFLVLYDGRATVLRNFTGPQSPDAEGSGDLYYYNGKRAKKLDSGVSALLSGNAAGYYRQPFYVYPGEDE